MSSTVADMSPDDLRELIETSVERKLSEFFSDPDTGLEIHESLRQQLLRQENDFELGQRGEPLANVVERLGLDQDHV